MRFPSGDQAGYSPQISVTCLTPPPSASMTKIRSSPSRSEAKAIRAPSGDQAGDQSFAGSRVRFRPAEPSAATT
jgi:hypothetical protein